MVPGLGVCPEKDTERDTVVVRVSPLLSVHILLMTYHPSLGNYVVLETRTLIKKEESKTLKNINSPIDLMRSKKTKSKKTCTVWTRWLANKIPLIVT